MDWLRSSPERQLSPLPSSSPTRALISSATPSHSCVASALSSSASIRTRGETTDARFAALRKLIPPAPQHPTPSVQANPSTHARPRLVASRPIHHQRFEPWLSLGIGLVTAPVFAWTPILQYMGWFLASLVHEMGHAAFAWFCGMPAVPAISIAGYAAAVHSDQSMFLALLVALAISAGA